MLEFMGVWSLGRLVGWVHLTCCIAVVFVWVRMNENMFMHFL
jgi:hypothetical protein